MHNSDRIDSVVRLGIGAVYWALIFYIPFLIAVMKTRSFGCGTTMVLQCTWTLMKMWGFSYSVLSWCLGLKEERERERLCAHGVMGWQVRFRVVQVKYPPIPIEQEKNAKPFAPMQITVRAFTQSSTASSWFLALCLQNLSLPLVTSCMLWVLTGGCKCGWSWACGMVVLDITPSVIATIW